MLVRAPFPCPGLFFFFFFVVNGLVLILWLMYRGGRVTAYWLVLCTLGVQAVEISETGPWYSHMYYPHLLLLVFFFHWWDGFF